MMRRILVVNVNWIGDVIFSSPIFKALKAEFPRAHISCLADPRVREVLESIPGIDEIIVYDEKGKHGDLFAKLALLLQLRRKRFDTAILLHRSLTRALLVYGAGIPRRIGYDEKGRGRYLTHRSEFPGADVHRSDRYIHIIESYGVNVQDRQCRLNVCPEADSAVKAMLAAENVHDDDFVVVVNTGGNWELKRWPHERFSRLIDRLMNVVRVKVILPGAVKDVPLIRKITAPLNCKPLNWAGRTNLKQLLALLKRADVVVSADSGPLHMASGVGTRVIGLFGPTRPEITGPRGEGRSVVLQCDVGCNREPCYHLKCPDNVCMKAITVDEVVESIKHIRNS
jgi:lipopolysaccharide heptosyltransferase II